MSLLHQFEFAFVARGLHETLEVGPAVFVAFGNVALHRDRQHAFVLLSGPVVVAEDPLA